MRGKIKARMMKGNIVQWKERRCRGAYLRGAASLFIPLGVHT
jgi:hypothetical protein